jgi:transposase
MAETLVEETITQESTVEDSPKARLEKFLRESKVKVFTKKDFDFPKDEKTQAKIRAEVDEFLQMREEWREIDRKLEKERNKWQ